MDRESKEYFAFVRCSNCGLIYLSPRPSESQITQYYASDYQPYMLAIEDDPSCLNRILRYYDQYKRCNAVTSKVKKPGKILDIGCSTGIFLQGMLKRGWETFGVEPSEYAASYATKRFGLNVKQCVLEEANFPSSFFDVITMWDVLEHLYNPKHTLNEINRILKPGGLLLINIPNPESWERNWFNMYWAGWDIPRHLYLFNQNTISQLLLDAQFEKEYVKSFTGRHGALILSLQNWLNSKKLTNKQKSLLLKIAKSFPSFCFTYPFFNIANWLNRSSYMAIFSLKSK
jgi:SAM-dependent methyltransferase